MTQDIVRYADKCIFLAEHISVLADDSQTIHIGIHYEADIRLAGFQQVAYLGQVLRQRFGIMRETSVRGAIQFDDILYTYCAQDSRNSQTSDGIDTVNSNCEMTAFDSLNVH